MGAAVSGVVVVAVVVAVLLVAGAVAPGKVLLICLGDEIDDAATSVT